MPRHPPAMVASVATARTSRSTSLSILPTGRRRQSTRSRRCAHRTQAAAEPWHQHANLRYAAASCACDQHTGSLVSTVLHDVGCSTYHAATQCRRATNPMCHLYASSQGIMQGMQGVDTSVQDPKNKSNKVPHMTTAFPCPPVYAWQRLCVHRCQTQGQPQQHCRHCHARCGMCRPFGRPEVLDAHMMVRTGCRQLQNAGMPHMIRNKCRMAADRGRFGCSWCALHDCLRNA